MRPQSEMVSDFSLLVRLQESSTLEICHRKFPLRLDGSSKSPHTREAALRVRMMRDAVERRVTGAV